MAKVADYHTSTWEPEYGQPNVYHDHDDCKYGSAIRPEHWRSGRGDAVRRCEECVGLG